MNQENQNQALESEATAATVAETMEGSNPNAAPDPISEPQAKATKTDAESSFGTVTGALALGIALLSIAGTGYLWWTLQGQSELDASIGRLRSDVTEYSSALDQLSGRLDGLTSTDKRLDESMVGLIDQLDRQTRQLEEIPLRIGRLEKALDSLPGVADKERSIWLIAEAEYYLHIANAQLTLARNADVALRAQELADEKLRDLGDPSLTRVRALLADEMTSVKAMPRPDSEGIVLALASLEKNLGKLPLAKQAPQGFSADSPANAENSGLQRAWRAIVDALMSVIRVRRTDEPAIPLVTGQEESMLRRSLDVDLQIARLAVIRNEEKVYRNALDAVAERIRLYFDVQSSEVSAALDTINHLAAAELPGDPPDISGSLALLLRLSNGAAAP
jgi:uroporphyrin-3 C-methyltransferase